MRSDRIRSVWDEELERLELEVISIERLVRGLESSPIQPWQPPAALGSLPVDLAVRARDLLARQRAASRSLTDALEQARKQVAFTGRVIDITGPSSADPVYFDLEA